MSGQGDSASGFLKFFILAAGFVILLWLSSWGSSRPALVVVPTVITISTGTPVPLATGLSSPQTPVHPVVQIFITPVNDNQFDAFDIKKVVVRASDSSYIDSGADDKLEVPCPNGSSVRAWAPGYAIATSDPCNEQITSFSLTLTHLNAIDNSYYGWLSAYSNCNGCHGNQAQPNPDTGATYDELNEWLRSGHANVFEDGKYFEAMYLGTSATGRPGIRAQPVIIGNEWVPVPPLLGDLYHGPGFRLDNPDQSGNCAYCHVPASIPPSLDLMNLQNLFPKPAGTWGEGITCDVCHKVFEVELADDKNPFPDRPGILSYKFLRPSDGMFITGPFSNILTMPKEGLNLTANHHATCVPVFSKSEFCAPCHFGKFGDMVVYNAYGEWRDSKYSKNPTGADYRTCQDCHMSHLYNDPSDVSLLSRQACAPNSPRFQNFDHNMMDFGLYPPPDGPIEIPRMIKDAADIQVGFDYQSTGTNTFNVVVRVTNTRAGHKFPTDSPLRHLILVVKAEDRVKTPLIQVAGERIPNWAGPGPISPYNIVDRMTRDVGIRDYAGLPGKIYANLLVEEETNLSPGMAYWNQTKHAYVDSVSKRTSDARLRPGDTDESAYSFAAPDEGEVNVTIDLVYRYAFYDLVVWKEWFDRKRADILVASVECKGPPRDPAKFQCEKSKRLIP